MLEMVNDGWMPYGFPPFQEDMEEVVRLVGSTQYEVRRHNGMYYIRRRSEDGTA